MSRQDPIKHFRSEDIIVTVKTPEQAELLKEFLGKYGMHYKVAIRNLMKEHLDEIHKDDLTSEEESMATNSVNGLSQETFDIYKMIDDDNSKFLTELIDRRIQYFLSLPNDLSVTPFRVERYDDTPKEYTMKDTPVIDTDNYDYDKNNFYAKWSKDQRFKTMKDCIYTMELIWGFEPQYEQLKYLYDFEGKEHIPFTPIIHKPWAQMESVNDVYKILPYRIITGGYEECYYFAKPH